MDMKLSTLAAAVAALVAATPAFAGETITFDNGVNLDWGLTATYTLSSRLMGPNALIASDAGANDGDNNFSKGSLTADQIDALLETKLYKGKTGFVFSAETFYNDVYHRSNSNAGPINTYGPANQFSSATRYYEGGYSRPLDAYGYTTFDMGTARATVRAGQEVVSWGEALYFPGISLAQGPADGTKAGIAGTETKDVLLPEDQISTDIAMNSRWTLLGQLQFNWHPTLAPAVGSFLSNSDAVGPGATCLSPIIKGVCSFGSRLGDIDPKNFGQWGVGTRYRVSDQTEVGLYFLDYSDRTPLPQINAFAPGGTYQIHYFDDIKLLGATFSTLVGPNVSVAGEVSQKFGAPVYVNTLVSPVSGETLPTPTRADLTQVNLNALANLGRQPFADAVTLVGEVSWVHTSNVTAAQAPGASALGAEAAYIPYTTALSFTQNALAASATLSLGWTSIFTDWDLSVPISYEQQLMGRSILGGVGGQGDKRCTVSANFTYRNNLEVGLTYAGYFGNNTLALPYQALFSDRSEISIVGKYKF